MTLIDFLSEFPDEASYGLRLRELMEQVRVICPKCGGQPTIQAAIRWSIMDITRRI